MHEKVLSLSYHAIVIFEQFILFLEDSFPSNVFHEITEITDALKKDAYDQNEQTIQLIARESEKIDFYICLILPGLPACATLIKAPKQVF